MYNLAEYHIKTTNKPKHVAVKCQAHDGMNHTNMAAVWSNDEFRLYLTLCLITGCFIINVPILKPYISATTNPR
jgi:hypothetical protein